MTELSRAAPGSALWRLNGNGCRQALLRQWLPNGSGLVSMPGRLGRWNLRTLTVRAADLFVDREAALEELRRRRASTRAFVLPLRSRIADGAAAD